MSDQIEDNHEFQFSVNEDVLCYTQNKHFKAKVLERRVSSNSPSEYYLLHYHNWNSKWDEWIENIDHQIKAYTKESMNKSNNANIKDTNKSETSVKIDTTFILTSNQKDEWLNELQIKEKEQQRLKNKGVHSESLNKEIFILYKKLQQQKILKNSNNSAVNIDKNLISMPEPNLIVNDSQEYECIFKLQAFSTAIKDNLVRQWSTVTRDALLIQLPKENGYRICDIFHDCKQWFFQKNSNSNGNGSGVRSSIIINEQEFDCNLFALKGFFCNSIKNNLMWNAREMKQLEILLQTVNGRYPDTYSFANDPCSVYGSEHLLRLMYTMPIIIQQVFYDCNTGSDDECIEKNIKQLKQVCNALLSFINKYRSKYLYDK